MDHAYQCFSCGNLSAFSDNEKCPSCGAARIRVLSADAVRELMDSGAILRPRTGRRDKLKA